MIADLEAQFNPFQMAKLEAVLQIPPETWSKNELASQVISSYNVNPSQLSWVWLKMWKNATCDLKGDVSKSHPWVNVVFMKVVEAGDLRILKFIIHHYLSGSHARDTARALSISYFQKYRLTQAPRVDKQLSEAASRLPSKELKDHILDLFCLCFTDYPAKQYAERLIRINNPLSAAHIRTLLLGTFLIAPKWTLVFTYIGNVEELNLIKEVCDSFGLEMEEKFPELRDRYHTIISLLKLGDREDAEVLLEQCFESLWKSWHEPKFFVSFLRYVGSRWPKKIFEWADRIPADAMLPLAWSNPEFLPLVKLPEKMPSIDLLIPCFESFSFEKGLYLEHVLDKYGTEAIEQAMATMSAKYNWKAFFVVRTISRRDEPINWAYVRQCLPENANDVMEWSLTLLRCKGAHIESLPELICKIVLESMQNGKAPNTAMLLFTLFPEMRSVKSQ